MLQKSALVICFFLSLTVFGGSNGAVSTETKSIVNALNAELVASKLKAYMMNGASMDPAIGSILVYIPSINTGYMCLLNNFDSAIDAAVDAGEIFKVIDYYAVQCSSDSNLVAVLKILQNTDTQDRLTTLFMTLFKKFDSAVVTLVTEAVNAATSPAPPTVAEINALIKRWNNLSQAALASMVSQIGSLKNVVYSDGTYYSSLKNLINNGNNILGTTTPTSKQKTNVNKSFKKMCTYLHKTFNQYFWYVRDWISSYPVSLAIKTNMTAQASYTTSSSIMAPAGKALLADTNTQTTIDKFFTDCYQI